jgi:hypothetical protein
MSALDSDRPSATVFAQAPDIGQFRAPGLGPDDILHLDEIQRRLAQSAYACLNPLQADWRTARWLDAGLGSRVWDHVRRLAAPEHLDTLQDHYGRLWLDAYRAGAPCIGRSRSYTPMRMPSPSGWSGSQTPGATVGWGYGPCTAWWGITAGSSASP